MREREKERGREREREKDRERERDESPPTHLSERQIRCDYPAQSLKSVTPG